MSSDKKAPISFELEKPVHVVAIAQGYYGNRIIYPGQKFEYSGRVKKGSKGDYVLPHWTEFDKDVKDNEIKVKGDKSSKPSSQKKAEPKSSKQKEIKDLL